MRMLLRLVLIPKNYSITCAVPSSLDSFILFWRFLFIGPDARSKQYFDLTCAEACKGSGIIQILLSRYSPSISTSVW